MKKYKFEISNTIEIEVISKDKESARQELVNNPDLYDSELAGQTCWISDGIEIN